MKTFSLTWLPQVLLEANLKVATVPGWERRGRGELGPTFGVLCHHTAGRKVGNMPALNTLINGRAGLPGPLSQLGLGRDGTYYVIAAGRCNHAGEGVWAGVKGNRHFIGIEAENTGKSDDPWPEIQMDAYRRGVAAILKHTGLSHERVAGHKEYAQPRGRKPDPSFDMVKFRADVGALMGAPSLRREPIPVETTIGGELRATLRRGAEGESVLIIQKVLRINETGKFDGFTEAAVREFQRKCSLVPDGIVGPKSWKQFLSSLPSSDPPARVERESRAGQP